MLYWWDKDIIVPFAEAHKGDRYPRKDGEMKIISLIENTSLNKEMETEHGLSLYIEFKNHKILFDMGQSDMFLRNAKKLGVDLSDVDIAILSHGHYDHGGGLEEFLKINQKAYVYVSKYAFGTYYNGTEKYIGLNSLLKENERLIMTDGRVELEEGITLFHCNENIKKYDLGSFGLNVKREQKYLPDDFFHEQYLLLEEDGKKVLFSGCSHKGILNIVEWFQPDVLIGGFHFSKLPLDEMLKGYANYLNGFATAYYTCHCTGEKQFLFMKQYMERLFYLSTGQSIQV